MIVAAACLRICPVSPMAQSMENFDFTKIASLLGANLFPLLPGQKRKGTTGYYGLHQVTLVFLSIGYYRLQQVTTGYVRLL